MANETLEEKLERVISLFWELRTEFRSGSARTEQQFAGVQDNLGRIERELEELQKTKWGPVQWAIIGVGTIAITVLGGILALVFQAGGI